KSAPTQSSSNYPSELFPKSKEPPTSTIAPKEKQYTAHTFAATPLDSERSHPPNEEFPRPPTAQSFCTVHHPANALECFEAEGNSAPATNPQSRDAKSRKSSSPAIAVRPFHKPVAARTHPELSSAPPATIHCCAANGNSRAPDKKDGFPSTPPTTLPNPLSILPALPRSAAACAASIIPKPSEEIPRVQQRNIHFAPGKRAIQNREIADRQTKKSKSQPGFKHHDHARHGGTRNHIA